MYILLPKLPVNYETNPTQLYLNDPAQRGSETRDSEAMGFHHSFSVPRWECLTQTARLLPLLLCRRGRPSSYPAAIRGNRTILKLRGAPALEIGQR